MEAVKPIETYSKLRYNRAMSARILSGNDIAGEIRAELSQRVLRLKSSGIIPGLGVILVGDNPASVTYVNAKQRACREVGIHTTDIRLPTESSEAELLGQIDLLNEDPAINGILVQLPLPPHISKPKIVNHIDPAKDIDGLHPRNLGELVADQSTLAPCTPLGIIRMLEHAEIEMRGSHVVVVGRSILVGKPLALLLLQREISATVTICHSSTRSLARITRTADILVAAIGVANMIGADMVAPGAVVIDVGINRISDTTAKRGYRLCGDVDFDAVSSIASVISPVPGGVGPMTIAMLLHNTVQAAEMRL